MVKQSDDSLVRIAQRMIYFALSDDEKAALKCAIVFPHRSLKEVLPKLFNTRWFPALYKRHNLARVGLRERGFLDQDGNITNATFDMLPPEVLAEMSQELHAEVKNEHNARFQIETEKYQWEQKYRILETEKEKLTKMQQRLRLPAEIVDTFSFLGVDENWMSVLICSNLVEQAMKKKLEKLGCPLKTESTPSFNDVREALGNALRDKESRRLEALFEPKEIWRIRSKMDHWGYKQKFDDKQAYAIFIMTKEIIDQIWPSK
jgi:hypothetical protein